MMAITTKSSISVNAFRGIFFDPFRLSKLSPGNLHPEVDRSIGDLWNPERRESDLSGNPAPKHPWRLTLEPDEADLIPL